MKNELVGIFRSIETGLFLKCPAFKSGGFGYQGLYGQYNLPQYDLVHGGGKDQNNSCRETMFKTSLN